eukprot:TRINITY_DN16596_c0_g1_i5.p1 TRINITY_DN16596_c0_g1~~TRINITY_DN16596_c0_g1_i5.p1  ORF type:complete len:109 (-),score=27.68 TRINITY_DN16596_c0_g1_i5:142-468(-)
MLDQAIRERPPANTKVDCTIKLYSNGFLVNDEERLRRYDNDSTNFLKDIKDGILPPELLEHSDGDANILVEYHLEETFVYAPKPLAHPVALENMVVAPAPTPPYLTCC